MFTKPSSKSPEACWLSCLTETLLIVYVWSAFNHFMKLGNSHLLNCSGPQRNFMACQQSRSAERNAERCFQIKLQFFRLDWHNLSSAKEELFFLCGTFRANSILRFTLLLPTWHWAAELKSWLGHSQASFQPSGHVLSAKSPFPEELQLSTHRERQCRNTVIIWGTSHADLLSVIKLALTSLFTFSAQCQEALPCSSSKKEKGTTELCTCYEHPCVCGRKESVPP